MIAYCKQQFKTASLFLAIFTLLTGLVYPVIVTIFAQGLFAWRANGSLIRHGERVIGSALIGQDFTSADYFWGRPSATIPNPYDGMHSTGSNFGPTNPNYIKTVQQRIEYLTKANPQQLMLFVDLYTASGSGLDPDIRVRSAYYQIPRIALARNVSEVELQKLVDLHKIYDLLRAAVDSRINVLQLNLALDAQYPRKGK